MKNQILFFLLVCCLSFSCQKDEEPFININQKEITISNVGGTQKVSFDTNTNWAAKSSASWCSVSPINGDASRKNTMITLSPNDTYEDRSCTVTIMAGSISKTITINQGQGLGLLVTKDKYELSNDAQTIGVDVKANVDYEIDISDEWITQVDTRGLTSTKLNFDIAKNESYDSRVGTITINQKNGNLSSTIKIYQSQEDVIILSNRIENISSESQTLEVELKTNIDFEVIIPEAVKAWISYISTRALRTETLLLSIAENKDYEDRSAVVYIRNKVTNIEDTLTVNQYAQLGLLVTKDKYELANDAQTIDVEVKANVDFDIDISDDWINQVNTRGLITTRLNFNIESNASYDNRLGTIVIKEKNGVLSSTIKVYQSQEDAIILSSKTENVSNESQTLEVELKTNVDFEMIIPDAAKSWVSYITTRALRTETVILSIAENEDKNDTRSTDIFIKNKASNLQDTLTIVQEKAPDTPTISTLDAFDVLRTSAKSRGKISSDGGAPILQKGLCWSTLEDPTIEDLKTNNGLGNDDFVGQIKNLEEDTKYFVRAYATNRAGTAYGNQISFSTISVVETPIISPKGGMFTSAQSVTITCETEQAEIRYTLDGSDPTETSDLYDDAILIEEVVTLKAKAYRTNWIASSVATESYIVNLEAQLIVGSANTIQHIDVSNDFIFRSDNLNDKDVFFVFSNQNSSSSRLMPQIVSNVETKNITAKSIIGSEPSTFLIPGKPSITEFNNNPWDQPRNGVEKTQSRQSFSIQSLMLGSQDYLYDEKNNSIISTVRKVISAHGKNLYVWVADNCWEQGGTKSYNVTQQMVDALASKFLAPGSDNDIYEWVTNIAGNHWGPTSYSNLISETDDIHIWLMDIDNDNKTSGTVTLGYFFSRDNFLKSYYSGSNEKLMFTIDAVLFAKPDYGAWDLAHYLPNRIISTLAHEFTHMIYFYQHEVLRSQTSSIAINEMSAQCMEDLVANKIEADGPRGVSHRTPSAGYSGNDYGRLPLYNSKNHYDLLKWGGRDDERLLNYSKTYAFGAYLMRNYGGANFIRELIQNNSTGVESIVAAVNANGGDGLNYGDVLQRFGIANLLSDQTTMATGYKFNTDGWITSTVNGASYDLGSINLYNYSPTPSIYNELPYSQQPNSNILYRAGSNLSGKNEWYIKGMDNDTKLTVVIK